MLKLYEIVFHLDHCRLLHDFWHCGFPRLNFLHLDLMLNMVWNSRILRMLRGFVLRWPCVTGPHLWTNSLLQFCVVDKRGNCKKSSCLLPLGLICFMTSSQSFPLAKRTPCGVLLELVMCTYVGQTPECFQTGYVLLWTRLQRKLHCQYTAVGRERVNYHDNYCAQTFSKKSIFWAVNFRHTYF